MASNNVQQSKQAAKPEQHQPNVRVNDEFVALDSVAVFKCRSTSGSSFAPSRAAGSASSSTSGGPPNSLDSFSHLLEWFTSDGIRVRAGETSKGKFGLKFNRFLGVNYIARCRRK